MLEFLKNGGEYLGSVMLVVRVIFVNFPCYLRIVCDNE